MYYLLFLCFLYVFIYLTAFFVLKKKDNYRFLSQDHTNIIKGLAILLVVSSHLGGWFGIRYLTPLGGTGVALFLICSGYGLSKSYEKSGLKHYWIKRLKGIFIPYFIVQIIVVLRYGMGIKQLMNEILIYNTTHPYGWYLQYLILWYIIFYLVNLIKLQQKIKISIYLILSLLILLVLKDSLWAEQAFSFTFGVLLAYRNDKLVNSKGTAIALAIIGIIFLGLKQIDQIRYLPYTGVNLNEMLIKLPLALSLILLTYQLQAYLNLRVLYLLGCISYEVYLVHGYCFRIFAAPSYLNIVMFLFIVIVLSIFLNVLVKLILRILGLKNNRLPKQT